MKTCVAEIEGIAPYSASRNHTAPRMEGESVPDHDLRTWREKIHAHADGRCYIPGIALKFALDSTARQIGLKIQGRQNKTWSTVFSSGVLCPGSIDLFMPAKSRIVTGDDRPADRKVPVTKDTLEFVDVYCHLDGRRGSGKRGHRRFPIVHEWSGVATFIIASDEITETVFHLHLEKCGLINGLGRYRAQNGGDLGRFRIATDAKGNEQFQWQDEAREVKPRVSAAA